MLIFLGETISLKFLEHLRDCVKEECNIYNVYGPAETTILSTYYLIKDTSLETSVSIGKALPNYHCQILDEFLQSVTINQQGELLVGGVGVFGGYLGRKDLSAKVLIDIDSEIFYRTGDLVRMNSSGLLYYQGRKDHQIKLHGQRIELGEIERCLLNTSISACVVMKWGDDHLVAYVQSSHVDEKQLRKYCQSHLPPHMIPSLFIILENLPLNANGKIDRKLLPRPDFAHLSSMHLTNDIDLSESMNEIELIVHNIWCDIFQL